MKSKIIKTLKIFFALLIIGLIGLVGYLKFALPNVGTPQNIKVESTPERIARGEYLANHVCVCMDCHSTRDWTLFAGPPKPGTLGKGGEYFGQEMGFPGKFYSKNITPFGIKNYTDGELMRAITCGVNKNGEPFFPVMPYGYYGQMDEEDIKSIIAYIKSIPSISSQPLESKADFPMSLIMRTIPQKANLQPMPTPENKVAYGHYLANAAACMECHTKKEKGKFVGEKFAGGFEFNLGNGYMLTSPNITPHESGIKNMTKEKFIERFKQYQDSSYVSAPVDMQKGEFQTVMPWTMYAGIKTEDLAAIYDYLRTIEPVEHTVERWKKIN